jgi:hypothetical protein
MIKYGNKKMENMGDNITKKWLENVEQMSPELLPQQTNFNMKWDLGSSWWWVQRWLSSGFSAM